MAVVVDVVDVVVVVVVDVVDVVVLIVVDGLNTEKMEFILPSKTLHLRNECSIQTCKMCKNSQNFEKKTNLFLTWKLSELMRCHICTVHGKMC